MTDVAHEAAELAGHPNHSIAKTIGLSMVGSTAAGVGTYQINTHIARATHAPEPSLSLTTGSMPPAGEGIAKTAHNVRKGYSKQGKGGKRHNGN